MDSEPEYDGFYFESDHVPLRGNRDYSNVLRTIAMLESCKIRLHGQLQDLESTKEMFLSNPELFLTKIRNNENIVKDIGEIKIPELPHLIGTYEFLQPAKPKIKEEPNSDSKPATVRGRIFDETKPETFNKLWTCEEQRRLEELLIEYPPEEKEMRRYAKIARALGNRTPQQVCSRIQKYFQKLYDAGMPIPGRKPKSRRAVQGKAKYFQRPSTFFPSFNVRVNMPDDDELDAEEWNIGSGMQSISTVVKTEDSDLMPEEEDAMNSGERHFGEESQSDQKKEAKLLYMLTELRNEKEQCGESYQPDPMAPLCDTCNVSACTLRRFHCRTCHIYLRQCADCLIDQLISNDFRHILHDVTVED